MDNVNKGWYLEALAREGSIVLWGFGFALHTRYTQRPVFTLKVAWPLTLATGAGLATALFWRFAIDSWLRVNTRADYPTTIEQWLAMTLSSLDHKQSNHASAEPLLLSGDEGMNRLKMRSLWKANRGLGRLFSAWCNCTKPRTGATKPIFSAIN